MMLFIARDVSTVIRVRNGEKYLGHTLETILDEEFEGTFEVIVVENESIDGSLEICKSLPPGILHLERAWFNSGRSLNLGCGAGRRASGSCGRFWRGQDGCGRSTDGASCEMYLRSWLVAGLAC